ncbi:hypothetical protein RB614_39680 [Phytohabitans sp. ZYX-F-186]|uniref:CBM2 domain-containing protein n=1 Tax=Phytohabitans maris TaxID=3071409 RepID=A0ABU0ZUB6_9ACTN|nr:hypothetical protein [Phytohabitans sp. ZYX-F-186]MDQ7910634.1 hypothetical protein [Phytohabitans sp. ZYX-F-186]
MDLRPGKPWRPAAAAVVLMVGLLVVALVSLRPSAPRPGAVPLPPPGTPPFLAGPAAPDAGPGTPDAPLAATRSPSPRRTTAAPPEVTGRYRVVETYRDSFIGEVRVANAASRSRPWSVRLRFSATGDLRAFWVEGAPRPTLQRSGDVFTFTGGAPVGAGRAAPLRFQFERDGPVPAPTTCSVNGTGCAFTART